MSPENGNRRAGNAAAKSVGSSNASELTRLAHKTQDQINKPIDPADYVYVVDLAGWGFEANYPEYLNQEQLDQYNRNPDLFAAKHYGFDDVEEYREWVHSDGIAYCSERTKKDEPCKGTLGGPCLSADEWRERHRSRPCKLHETLATRACDEVRS